MADQTYPRPAFDPDVLLDELAEAGVDRGAVDTGNPEVIGISIDGATNAEIDAIYYRVLSILLSRRLEQREDPDPAQIGDDYLPYA